MAIYLVPDVSLMGQDKKNACWWFSAKMIHKWSTKKGKTVNNPEFADELPGCYKGDFGWALSTGGTMATHLNMDKQPRKTRGFSEMLTLLQKGPIWAAGLKGIARMAHVVVFAGVADTGVLVLDPLPLKNGEKSWKTWDWVNQFLALDVSEIDANLLTVK